jgi:hypothetical protein
MLFSCLFCLLSRGIVYTVLILMRCVSPATSRATNPRQHQPKDLSKPRRDIHLVEIKYCEDTRPQNKLNTAKEQHKDLCNIPRSLCYSPHHPFGCGRHHLQHSHFEAFQGTGSQFSKELRILPPSFMCTLWTLLLNLSIPDVPFPVLLSTSIRSRFQAKPATLLIPIDFSFPFRGGGALRYSVPKWFLFLN